MRARTVCAGVPRRSRAACRTSVDPQTGVRDTVAPIPPLPRCRPGQQSRDARALRCRCPACSPPCSASSIGSFLNVCIYRLPRDQSIVWPASRCTTCGRELALVREHPGAQLAGAPRPLPHVRRAHQRRCTRSSKLLTAAVFVADGTRTSASTPLFAVRLLFGCAMIVLFVIDLQHQILPNEITLPGIAAGLVASLFLEPGWRDALIGAIAGGGVAVADRGGLRAVARPGRAGLRRRQDAGDDRRLPRLEADAAHARVRVVHRLVRRPDRSWRRGAQTGSRSCRSARSSRSARGRRPLVGPRHRRLATRGSYGECARGTSSPCRLLPYSLSTVPSDPMPPVRLPARRPDGARRRRWSACWCSRCCGSAAAARDMRQRTREADGERAFVSAALEDAIRKLREQERAMAARAEGSERLSDEIVSSLASGLLVVGLDGEVRMLNPAGRRLLRLPALAPNTRLRALLAETPGARAGGRGVPRLWSAGRPAVDHASTGRRQRRSTSASPFRRCRTIVARPSGPSACSPTSPPSSNSRSRCA